jgi:8-oxo-dGTP pyrophosphatase MutT (NUDIX family)
VLIGLNLVISFTVPNISWQAHIGGLITGALVALAMQAVDRVTRGDRPPEQPPGRAWKAGRVVRGDGDGWTRCAAGHRHWGRYGAAGLLLRDRRDGVDRVVLQHRAWWSHEGGTWGIPGGARDSDETAVEAALRESAEEANLEPTAVRPYGELDDDHGGWSYTTGAGRPDRPVDPEPTGGESEDVRWVDVADLATLPLHPGFAAAWPRLRDAPAAAVPAGRRGQRGGCPRPRRRLVAGPGRRDRPAARRARTGPARRADARRPAAGCRRRRARPAAAPDRRRGRGRGAGRADGGGRWPVELVAAPGSGDDMLVEVANADGAGDQVVVVTADRGLRVRLDEVGARWVGPSWLLRRVERA